ncbi:MAG: hypothetical protein COW03_04330 [Cytophagales bacterium CG12_big_fil_rev_8_21_14_0_65_40_12]|nr:MAG: hypothetical protein COW03_04330 [Cytophagales bacterium CG12_big_fil_rev_8_21_14_0_65_40_12]PIW05822.1 MAG: hypothetical protein COW40_02735 [Cytophagales bacterium CG17_big_fil_post_rev_8_21_14_2_50_40_13]
MLKNSVRFSALLWAFLFCANLNAQFTQSAYSSFGVGEVSWGGYSQNAAMGGLGISFNNRLFLNNINPALVATNYEAIFQIGASFDSRTYNNGQTQYSSFTGGFKDFGLSLPIKYGKWNLAFGLSPYTSVNYSLYETDNTSSASQLDGSGGIDQVYLTNAFRIGDNLLVGIKGSFLFGSILREIEYTILDAEGTTFGTTVYNERRSFSDFTANVGLNYSFKVGELKKLNLGAFYNLEADVRSRNLTKFESRDLNGNTSSSDTLVANVDSQITIPHRLGFGISIEKKDKYVFGLDLQSQPWSNYVNEAGVKGQNFGNAFRIALGGEFTPNNLELKALSRFTYRFGVHYERTPYLINSQEVNDFGINIGMSLPLNAFWGVSNINFGATLGRRGSVVDGLIRENYLKLNLGFSLQDQTWFVRQKYN